MDIQNRKIKFVESFLKLQNDKKLSLLEDILYSETKDELEPMTIKEFNSRIDRSEKDFENGDQKSHQEVFDKFDQ